ncbi:PolC-type DNA polymerase III [Dongia sp.]|uniref:3'-5' exonuclease n=1 Tax=Dongia sp. TaxID=1977262 RepID=UPI0035B12E72
MALQTDSAIDPSAPEVPGRTALWTRLFGALRGSLRSAGPIIRCGHSPALHTPLELLEALVLDTETTGLNVRSDRIISAAGFSLSAGSLSEAPLFDRLVDPGRPIPAASSAFHGIVDEMVREAGDFAEHWPEILRHLEIGLVIGHQIFFDLAILGREVRRLGARLQPPVALDTALLYAGLHPGERHRDLTPCCAAFGIEIVGRHTAKGDAAATGALFLELVPLLKAHGIRTLGEALAFERAAILHHPRRWRW